MVGGDAGGDVFGCVYEVVIVVMDAWWCQFELSLCAIVCMYCK